MGVKIKKNFKDLENLIPKIRKEFLRRSKRELETLIVDNSISKGISPVEGKGKFQKYSKSYKDAIKAGRYAKYSKTISPVNMKLSGEMLESFDVKENGNSLKVSFDHELAEIHNDKGAGQSKVIRRLLPNKQGERFKASILRGILDLLDSAIAKILGK